LNNEKTSITNISLDKFLSENTSEDNISFEIIMSEAEKKNRLKLNQSWLHDREQFLKLVISFFKIFPEHYVKLLTNTINTIN